MKKSILILLFLVSSISMADDDCVICLDGSEKDDAFKKIARQVSQIGQKAEGPSHLDPKFLKYICRTIENGNPRSLRATMRRFKVNLAEDITKIKCKNTLVFPGGNLLQLAANHKHIGIIGTFVHDYNVDINVKDENGETILDWIDKRIEGVEGYRLKILLDLRGVLVDDWGAKHSHDL